MFDTRFNSRFVAISDQLLNASEKRDRLEGFGEVLSFLQDVSTPSRVVPVFTGRWWAFSLHDRFDRYSIDESRLEKEIGGLCQEVAEKLSHFDGKDKQLSLTILLGQTARNTMAAVNSEIVGLPASWTSFWRPSAKDPGRAFGEYGVAGNEFGNRVEFRCGTEEDPKMRCLLLKDDPLYQEFAFERHRGCFCVYDSDAACTTAATAVTLHLGVTPWQLSPPSAVGIGEQAAYAEDHGYQSFWLPENHFGEGALPDPLMLLASAAATTQRIQLATTSYLLTLRNPLQAAEQVAVLDQLSGGRVLLGVGRGYAPEMLRAFHVPVAEKRRIFAWTLDLMQKAWQGEAISLDGNPDNAVQVFPRPVQQPYPPIWVAAFGPKALAQAGRMGLPYLSRPWRVYRP